MARPIRRTGYALLTAALLGGLALTPAAQSRPQSSTAPPQVSLAAARPAPDPFTNALVRDLRRQRYQVSLGYPKLWSAAECDSYTYPVMGECYGNNPAAPYVVPIVKSWPDEYVDPHTRNAFGKTRTGYSATYRMDRREAIVVYGKLPPPGRYLGFQSYVFTGVGRMHPLSAPYLTVRKVLPDVLKLLFNWVPGEEHTRLQSFSSISNAINNVVIERQSGASWGQTRYFVLTPDRDMDRAVRAALARQGVPPSWVFTEPVPSRDGPDRDARKSADPPVHRLGLGRRANDFATMIRYSLPNNEQAGNAWRQNPPLRVLRIRTAPAAHRAPKPFPPLVYDKRTTPHNEVTDPSLRKGLVGLVKSVCKRWGQPCDSGPFVNVQIAPIRLVGRDCREVGMDCIGDTQDATYLLGGARSLDHGEVYAIVGTLGTQTGNATYAALSVNNLQKLKGILNVSDPALKGSARAYARSVKNQGKFFVHYLTRDCAKIRKLTDGECTSIPKGQVPVGVKFAPVLREYVAPGTTRGPNPAQILNPRIINFKQP